MVDLEKKRDRTTMIVALAAAVIVFGIAAPFIFTALKGALAFGALGALSLFMYKAAPVLGMKVANWQLKAIKAEAAANPIETLQSERIDRQEKYQLATQYLRNLSTQVRNFDDSLEALKDRFGVEDSSYKKMSKDRDTLKLVEAQTSAKIRRAKKALEDFDLVIEKAQMIYKAALAGQAANKAARMVSSDVFAQIKTETALESVQSTMNSVFAELETTMSEDMSKFAAVAESPPDSDTTRARDNSSKDRTS